MKLDSNWKNVLAAIISFLIIFFIFRLAGLVVEPEVWVIILLLIMIYLEILDFKDKKR